MKTEFKFIAVLFYTSLTFTSCSTDSSDEADQVNDPIIGKWLIINQNDYYCDSNDIFQQHIADPNQIDEFKSEGTWQGYRDGEKTSSYGTWKLVSKGNYEISYELDDVKSVEKVEFDDNSMKLGISDCRTTTFNGETTNWYSYDLYVKQ